MDLKESKIVEFKLKTMQNCNFLIIYWKEVNISLCQHLAIINPKIWGRDWLIGMLKQALNLKGHSTSWKMNVYLKWVIYVEKMWNYFWIWSFLDWEKPENLFLAYVDERQQLPECTCFTALGHANW